MFLRLARACFVKICTLRICALDNVKLIDIAIFIKGVAHFVEVGIMPSFVEKGAGFLHIFVRIVLIKVKDMVAL